MCFHTSGYTFYNRLLPIYGHINSTHIFIFSFENVFVMSRLLFLVIRMCVWKQNLACRIKLASPLHVTEKQAVDCGILRDCDKKTFPFMKLSILITTIYFYSVHWEAITTPLPTCFSPSLPKRNSESVVQIY